jgi:adenylosuccinate lyase
VERNFGVAFAHSLIGYESLLTGLSRVEPNAERMQEALLSHPEVLAEAIQTILRREGQAGAYETLKELTRGKEVTIEDIRSFVKGLIIPEATKLELLAMTPATYLGLAEKLAKGKN